MKTEVNSDYKRSCMVRRLSFFPQVCYKVGSVKPKQCDRVPTVASSELYNFGSFVGPFVPTLSD